MNNELTYHFNYNDVVSISCSKVELKKDDIFGNQLILSSEAEIKAIIKLNKVVEIKYEFYSEKVNTKFYRII